mgnify:CR=1 FL=1
MIALCNKAKVKNEVKKLGRPVNENSVRQLRIKELELKILELEALLKQAAKDNEPLK